MIEYFSAVLLASKDPARLAAFYRDVLGIPLEDEKHRGLKKHYGCTLGDLHFAIHPVENFDDPNCGVGAVKLAFTVFDMEAFVKRLGEHGVKPLYPPRDQGFAVMTALHDPDGNYVEFTQLSNEWFRHLAERRDEGHDVLRRWNRGRRKRVR